MPRQGDTVVFHCGASLEETADDFTLHTLLVHIKKWIGGSRKWLLTVNEQIEPILLYDHYEARLLPMSEDLKEVEFKILRKSFIIIACAFSYLVMLGLGLTQYFFLIIQAEICNEIVKYVNSIAQNVIQLV